MRSDSTLPWYVRSRARQGHDYSIYESDHHLLLGFWGRAERGHHTVKHLFSHIDGFHSIFLLWYLEGKWSCDVDIDQSAGSMVM